MYIYEIQEEDGEEYTFWSGSAPTPDDFDVIEARCGFLNVYEVNDKGIFVLLGGYGGIWQPVPQAVRYKLPTSGRVVHLYRNEKCECGHDEEYHKGGMNGHKCTQYTDQHSRPCPCTKFTLPVQLDAFEE